MKKEIKDLISNLKPGHVSTYKGLTVIPLFPKLNEELEYISLRQALMDETLDITEISEGGSVPDLKVLNKGDKPVLAIDGEEIKGAKQNRVLNTTILIKEKSALVIPVSCTEQGRWTYQSRKFNDSDVIMARNARMNKERAVMRSLDLDSSYRSDQGRIWDDIEYLSERRDVRSSTSAMRDVFTHHEKDLQKYIDHVKATKDQRGIICAIDGEISGMDIVSRADVYAQLHEKFIRSYAIELSKDEESNVDFDDSKLKKFIDDILGTEEKGYESVGYGKDYRYRGVSAIGSSLIYEKIPIHTTFFNTKLERGNMDPYADVRRRRNHILDIDNSLR